MSRWFAGKALSLGRTPLVRMNRVTDGARAAVSAGAEGRNPASFVTRRTAPSERDLSLASLERLFDAEGIAA